MRALTCATAIALLLTACSSASPQSDHTSTDVTPHGSAASAASPAAESPNTQDSTGVINVDRCGVAAKGVAPFTLRLGGARLPAGHLGSGTNVAVLLHQTDADAACGWLPAAQLMAERGIRIVVFDLCGYGEANCDAAKPPTPAAQVAAAAAWARQHGATRVTIVGASMGGAVALGTAHKVAPQAVVDLSGPMSWDGVQDSATAARSLRIPILAAAATNDTNIDAAALAKAIASGKGPHHRFVRATDGHGIELLTSYSGGKNAATPLLGAVVRWVKGDYA